jgi:adenylate cyclase
LVFTLLAVFAWQRADAQERAENPLLNILPGAIVEKLKARPQTIADAFASAPVLFADVVDFTPMAERISPSQVVEMLDQIFGHFDDLVERNVRAGRDQPARANTSMDCSRPLTV